MQLHIGRPPPAMYLQRHSSPEPCDRVLFCPLIWDVRLMYRMVCSLHPQELRHFDSAWNTPTFIASLLAYIQYLFPHLLPPALYPYLCLCSLLSCVEFWCLGFWCPPDLYLFVVLIYFSLSPWNLSLSFPFYWVYLLFFLLFMGEMFSQGCWGFFVWSAVLGVLFSFEGTNTLYLNLTYPLLAAHEERSSKLYTCLTSTFNICFISKHISIKNHTL